MTKIPFSLFGQPVLVRLEAFCFTRLIVLFQAYLYPRVSQRHQTCSIVEWILVLLDPVLVLLGSVLVLLGSVLVLLAFILLEKELA